MIPSIQLVVFTLEGATFALELAKVHRVVRAMEVTSLPHAPEVVLGVVNIQGELLAAVNLRRRFRLPEREITPSDQFIIVNMTVDGATRKVVLVVDGVSGMMTAEQESIVIGGEIVAGMEYVQGIAKIAGDLILIHDLNRCLSLHEEKLLQGALAEHAGLAKPDNLAKLDQ
jgi:purine-binding chemotaxis protein CheW